MINIDCYKDTFDPSTIKKTPPDLFVIGSVMIVVSGVMGIVNTNRECKDCNSLEELEDFIDTSKLISNIQYSALIVGGILMAIGNSNQEFVQKE
ncbi:MAG: hypothetical protein IIB95_10730 [Candidatus Marinimicrobia bacterium]|nr:hypothetical protein [Candidatus Neomarinimicrobiota bacterium]MCH7764198.1 hypothetical protein [Candidatus Neomarinimicrobiota bacterium]